MALSVLNLGPYVSHDSLWPLSGGEIKKARPQGLSGLDMHAVCNRHPLLTKSETKAGTSWYLDAKNAKRTCHHKIDSNCLVEMALTQGGMRMSNNLMDPFLDVCRETQVNVTNVPFNQAAPLPQLGGCRTARPAAPAVLRADALELRRSLRGLCAGLRDLSGPACWIRFIYGAQGQNAVDLCTEWFNELNGQFG